MLRTPSWAGLDTSTDSVALPRPPSVNSLRRIGDACLNRRGHSDPRDVSPAFKRASSVSSLASTSYLDNAEDTGDACTSEEEDVPTCAVFDVRVETQWGDTAVLVGSVPALGSWQPERGLRLATDEDCYPIWKGKLASLGYTNGIVEYKVVILRADGSAEWEPLVSNRRLPVCPGTARVEIEWDVPDTLPPELARHKRGAPSPAAVPPPEAAPGLLAADEPTSSTQRPPRPRPAALEVAPVPRTAEALRDAPPTGDAPHLAKTPAHHPVKASSPLARSGEVKEPYKDAAAHLSLSQGATPRGSAAMAWRWRMRQSLQRDPGATPARAFGRSPPAPSRQGDGHSSVAPLRSSAHGSAAPLRKAASWAGDLSRAGSILNPAARRPPPTAAGPAAGPSPAAARSAACGAARPDQVQAIAQEIVCAGSGGRELSPIMSHPGSCRASYEVYEADQ